MKLPKLVGNAKRIYAHLKTVVQSSRVPIALVGPTGTGKTLIGLHLLRWFEKQFAKPAYYIQLSPDVSRTTLVGGFRLIRGSLVPVKGIIMRAMEEGAMAFLDEFAHASSEDQAALNSALNSDHLKVVALGEIEVWAQETTRFILAHNPLQYVGQHPLPNALRRRLYTVWVDYPDYSEEVDIATSILKREHVTVPPAVVRYLVNVARTARENREDEAPIAAANVAAACRLLALYARKQPQELLPPSSLSEPLLRGLYQRIHNTEAESTADLADQEVLQFLRFVIAVGKQRFGEIVENSFGGAYLPESARSVIRALIPEV